MARPARLKPNNGADPPILTGREITDAVDYPTGDDETATVPSQNTSARGRAARESLAIPDHVRRAVDERDDTRCRVCGKWLGEARALHHIRFGGDVIGMGGRRVHEVDEIVTVCWMYGGNCHDRVHAEKHTWQDLLLEVVHRPGVTAMQLRRWKENRGRRK